MPNSRCSGPALAPLASFVWWWGPGGPLNSTLGGKCMSESGSVPETRDLTAKEYELLKLLLENGTSETLHYLSQLQETTVVGRCSCGCPTLDLAVAGKAASLGSPTTLLAEAGGISPEGVHFAITLHAREGLLSELEVYSIYGEGTFTLPDVASIEFYTA
jgi:hypothetical protein